jgi:hypothetical protein
VTGKEAIHLVRTSHADQVRQWLTDPTSCATLRLVCGWRLDDEYGWMTLLREVGLLPVAPTGTARAEALWREGFYTDKEIATRCGLTLYSTKALRRTTFRDATWSSRAEGNYQRAYHLAPT